MNNLPLKLFIVLMEDKQNMITINAGRLEKLLNEEIFADKHDEITYEQFDTFCKDGTVNTDTLYRAVKKDFNVFEYSELPDFDSFDTEATTIIKNNNKFLKELLNLGKPMLLNVNKAKAGNAELTEVLGGYSKFSTEMELVPNLISLKEFMVIVLLAKERSEMGAHNFTVTLAGDTKKKAMGFSELKVLVLLLAKYLYLKFRHVYNYQEETFIQHLLWYLFLKVVNNPKMNMDDTLKSYNSKMENNIIYHLSSTMLRPSHLFEEEVIQRLEELFVVFNCHFSKLGNPHINLDIKKLVALPSMQAHKAWITAYAKGPQSDFRTFIEILRHIVSFQPSSLTYESAIKKFISSLRKKKDFRMQTEFKDLPVIEADVIAKARRLFAKYSHDGTYMYVNDFYFMCKDNEIVPILYSNKEVIALFYQCSIRKLVRFCKTLNEVFDEQNFYYITIDDFVRLLIEFTSRFVKVGVPMDLNSALSMFFKKLIRL